MATTSSSKRLSLNIFSTIGQTKNVDYIIFKMLCIQKTCSLAQEIHRTMAKALCFMIIFYFHMLALFSQNTLIAAYTLTSSQSLRDGQTLISQGGTFELGFFSPSNTSRNRYMGIWYKNIPVHTVVWVANREFPVPDTSGVMKIEETANIVIVNGMRRGIWSSNSSKVVGNPIIELLESGNLILRNLSNEDPDSYLWQSFDYPGDTLLPGMKIGWNLKMGLNRYLSSWRNSDDPSRGDFTFGLELTGYPQLVMRKGSKMYYRKGSWNGIRVTGTPELEPNSIITYEVVQNAEEYTMMFQLVNRSVLMRAVLGQSGTESRLQRSIWNYNTNTWVTTLSTPRDICDEYAQCGNNSICTPTHVAVCQCLKGFKPKSPNNWRAMDWSQGCVRGVQLNCSNGEGFRRFTGVKLPDTSNSWFNMSMTLDQCRVSCLNNCSCQAYVNANIKGGGSGCIMWYTDLIDIKQLGADGQDLYVRMPASELDFEATSRKKKAAITIVIVTSIAGVIVLSLGSLYIWKKIVSKGGSERNDFELPLYSMGVITAATAKFSVENKLGEGGFGPVYKGKLEGQDIAVKRLSKDSTQGVDAFKNEVILISKLQHKNLVRLVGCCSEGEEKMLVYEYMQNNSLDSFIFDETKRSILDWQKRFQIIQGIAGGLLYLHQESRVRIIHRDLKASNILLDSEMVPKISDFGMARIFGGDQVEAKTRRVVGTYGYMSPEYVIDGKFSVKSDVFSFGVLVLELISGKKNWGFRHAGHDLNLIGHAWTLWNEDRSSEFVDESMTDTYCVQDVLRYIHIGLLCVQKETEQRPTMSTVVIMLSSETAVLPKPQRPGFFMERTPLASSKQRPCNSNEFTITMVEGR